MNLGGAIVVLFGRGLGLYRHTVLRQNIYPAGPRGAFLGAKLGSMLACFRGTRPLQTYCVKTPDVPSRLKGYPFRCQVGSHVGMSGGPRPRQTFSVNTKYLPSRSKGCLFRCQVRFNVGMFRGRLGLYGHIVLRYGIYPAVPKDAYLLPSWVPYSYVSQRSS